MTKYGRLQALGFGLWALTVSTLLSITVSAQQTEPRPETLALTLDDAVQRAVAHNPDLAIVRLNTEIEAARVSESQSAFSPIFTTSLGRSSTATPPSSSLLGSQAVDVRDWFSSTGVRQRLRWGAGTWSASWDASRTTTNNPFTSFDPSLQSGFQVAFSQPLLKDRAIDASRQQYGIAKRNQEISDLRFRESATQTVAAVKQAYWTFKATLANVGVQQQSLELADELARQTGIRVKAGDTPPLDLVQAQAEVASRRESLIRARAESEDAEDQLRRLIMDPSDPSFWSVRLDPTEEPSSIGAMPDVDLAVRKALDERIDLARAGREREIARTNVEYFNNQKLPDVRLETSYRGNGLAGTELLRTGGFPGVVTGTSSAGFGNALGQALGSDFPAWSVGVTVSYPLGRGFEEASLVEAQVAERQASARIASLRLNVAEAIRQSGRQVRSASERVDAARASAALAQERFTSEQRRFEVGLSTTFLVTQAQRDLLQAQVNQLRTTLEYESALVAFEMLQQAPLGTGDGAGSHGANVIPLGISTPRGLFRQGTGSGF